MEIREFKYIITIAEEGSITRAADKLFLSQSSLSQFLNDYEAKLHTKLFKRTTTGVTLTYSGEVLLDYARRISHEYDNMLNEIADINHLQSGRIKLGIATLRATCFLAPILDMFTPLYPHIDLQFEEANTYALEERLLKNKLDIALLATPLKNKNLYTEFLAKEEVFLVARKGHPVLQYVHVGEGGPQRPWVSLADAAKYQFVLNDHGTLLRSISDALFKKNKITPMISYDRLSATFALSLVERGLGLGFMYQSYVPASSNLVYLSIGKECVTHDLLLAYPENGYRSKATKAFAQIALKALEAIPPVPSEIS